MAAQELTPSKAFATLQPAVRFTLDDVVELPSLIERYVDVPMGPKQEKIYRALMPQCYAAVQNHEITAANAGRHDEAAADIHWLGVFSARHRCTGQ
jgi:hypothetical protein